MIRSRALLHFRSLPAFTDFCAAMGWVQEETQGEFEVLRMLHGDTRRRLYVHAKSKTAAGQPLQHVTVWGASEVLARAFIKAKYRRTHPPLAQEPSGGPNSPSGTIGTPSTPLEAQNA